MSYVIRDNKIVFENGRPVMTDEPVPEIFNMVDNFIKLGVAPETGNQIANTTNNLEPDKKRAVMDNFNAMSDLSVDATQTIQDNRSYVIRNNRIVFENGRPVMTNEPAPEIFNMVDNFIKLGVDAETGNQIMKSAKNLSSEERQAISQVIYDARTLSQEKRQVVVSAISVLSDSRPFVDAAQRMAAYDTLCEELSQLNTMRGGTKGFKGFVGEHMQAANETAIGRATRVVNDNGAIDLIFEGKNGRAYPQQLKIGYKPGQIDFSKYKGQTVIVDKGNPYLRELQAEGARHGIKVVEGTVTEAEAKWWADAMQLETKVTGKTNSVIVPQVQQMANNLSAMHAAGKQVGKTGAMYGAGFSIGKNIVGMMRGDITAGEAVGNVAVDTAISYGTGYATGAIGSAVARAAAGRAVGSAIGGAVTGAVGSATAAIGGVATTATAGAVGAIGSAGAAVGGALTTATAGTAIGGAVATGVGAVGAAGAAIGAAAVAAAPVVAVGAVIGGLFSLFFGDD